MIISAQVATATEATMLLPMRSVAITIVSGLWAKFAYREKIKWISYALCLAGVVVGSLHFAQ